MSENETTDYDIVGHESDNNCHICGRDMENFTPRKGNLVEKASAAPGDWYVNLTKGTGTCREHGVSYSALSVQPPKRYNCNCGKEDCPVCESRRTTDANKEDYQ